jgi:hypothetical protein
VDNAPPTPDIIALSLTGPKTLTFSQPIDNLLFAILNAGGICGSEPHGIIRFTGDIPEPSTWTLALAGAAAVAIYRRRSVQQRFLARAPCGFRSGLSLAPAAPFSFQAKAD